MKIKLLYVVAFSLFFSVNSLFANIDPLSLQALKVSELSKVQDNRFSQIEKKTLTQTPTETTQENNSYSYDNLSQLEKFFFQLDLKRAPELNLPITQKSVSENIAKQFNTSSQSSVVKNSKISANLPKDKQIELLKKEQYIEIKETENEISKKLFELNKDKIALQFGYDTFDKANQVSFSNLAPTDPNYILGPGDLLDIKIWGKIDESLQVEIDTKGEIFIPKIGPIQLANTPFHKASEIIKHELRKEYVNFEVNISLKQIKPMTIYIIGNVKSPGAYTVSSLTNLIQALYLAGGPNKNGSLRKITINQANKKTIEVDLYHFLLNGNLRKAIQLNDQDTIYIPPIGDVIKLSGEVKRPGIYEIKENDTLNDAILNYASGYSVNAMKTPIIVNRKAVNSRQIIDIDATKAKTFLVQNADIITVKSISNIHTESISITGQVEKPGKYEFSENLNLSQFINKAGGLKINANTKLIEIYRYISENKRKLIVIDLTKTPDFELEPLDTINISASDAYANTETVQISGAIREPGNYYLLEDMTIYDLVTLAKLEPHAETEQVELFRNKNGKETLFKLNLTEILSNQNNAKNFVLEKNDHIFIRSKVNANRFKEITLTGEVKYPGKYLSRDNESLLSIINRAGGFTDNAFLNGAVFYRESTKKLETAGKQKLIVEEQKRLIFDETKIKSLNDKNENMYQQAIGFLTEQVKQSKGRVTLNLEKILNKETTIIIEDKDRLHIPETPVTIQVIGGIIEPTAVLYSPELSVNDYIELCGGYSEFANKRKIYIFKANGAIRINDKNIEQGDTIYIPEKIKPSVDWLSIITKVSTTIFNVVTTLKITGTL